MNDTDGEFELRLFEDQYKDNKVDINHFIERKRELLGLRHGRDDGRQRRERQHHGRGLHHAQDDRG